MWESRVDTRYDMKTDIYTEQKKKQSHAYLKYVFSGCECCFANFILCIN